MTGPTAADATAVLPCGRSVAELVDLVADPASAEPELRAHVATCPHCRAELAELDGRWDLVRRLASTPLPTPAGLVSRVLTSVRDLRPRRFAPGVELAEPGGSLRVGAPAVVLLGRQLFREFAAERREIALRTLAVAEDGLQVRVALRYGTPIAEVAAELREWLSSGLRMHLGDAVPAIHVHVDDVLPD
jgi:hypothetical protein